MNSRTLIGIILIVFGAIFLLDSAELIQFSFGEIISTWWPLFIIYWGVNELIQKNSSLTWSLSILTAGVLLQIGQLDLLPFSFWELFWPLLLIIVGISFLTGHRRKSRNESFNGKNVDKDLINITSIFSGAKERVNSQSFKGGRISAIFGAADVDISEVQFESLSSSIEIEAIFGGIELRVPRNIRIIVNGTPIFGGVENNTHPQYPDDENLKSLQISYLAVFGGIEIKD